MKKLSTLLLFFTSTILLAQTANELFDNANDFYKNGKYQEAILAYEKIEKTDKVSSELYYNLANCYYKLNKVAPSIYNYEKALQLNPSNSDAKNNLIIANRLTLDRIEELPTTVFQKINKNYLQKLTYNTWAVLCIVFSILASALFLLFYFAENPTQKRTYFTTSSISFILLAIVLFITYSQYNQTIKKVEAIVFTEEINVTNEPTATANRIFSLHEGTKVMIIDAVDNWKKIKLIDGKTGWITSENLKEL